MDIQFLMKQAKRLEKAMADAHLGKATGGVTIPGIMG
jgi:hypothetical protein